MFKCMCKPPLTKNKFQLKLAAFLLPPLPLLHNEFSKFVLDVTKILFTANKSFGHVRYQNVYNLGDDTQF